MSDRMKEKNSVSRKSTLQSSREPLTESSVTHSRYIVPDGALFRVAIMSNGSFAVTSGEDGTVRSWDLETGDTESTVICEVIDSEMYGLALSQNTKLVAAGCSDGNIYMIDPKTPEKQQSWNGHGDDEVGNLVFVNDGRELLSAAQGRYIKRWDISSKTLIAKCRTPHWPTFGVAATEDCSLIVGAAVGSGITLWDGVDDSTPVTLPENIGNHSPISVTADGKFAFTGTENGSVSKWNIESRTREVAFEGHIDSVTSVSVTPDGRFCVSAGYDKTVRIWAAETGECLAILCGHEHVVWGTAITPDARHVASVSHDSTLMVWEIPEDLIARASTSVKRGYVNAKVVLLGDSGVGKSGLALRLWHNSWEKTESTHGIEIKQLKIKNTNSDGIEHEVWLWDLAGQSDYRLTHQLFMDQTSLVLFVFDPQGSDMFNSIGYWQSALSKISKAKDVPGILVAGRCDRPGLAISIEEAEEWAASRELHGPVLTAAKVEAHQGANELLGFIEELIPWSAMEFRTTIASFPKLKSAILSVRNTLGVGGVVVTLDELNTRISMYDINLEYSLDDLEAVVGLLAGEGVLHKLPYGDLIVLEPSWVNSYASTIVKLAGEAENKLGHVPQSAIQPGKLPDDGTPRLSVEDEQQLLPALRSLFLERALAWSLDTNKGPMLVFPNYVRAPRPDSTPRPSRSVIYRFDGPLEEIYSTLVVLLNYSGLFSGTKLYRRTADFHTATRKTASIAMQEFEGKGEMELCFDENLDEDVQASFQRFVHDHLVGKSSSLKRLRNFFCPKCREEATDRRAIESALEKKRTKLLCLYCDPTDPGIINLDDILERQFESKDGEENADEAFGNAKMKISTASMEQVMIGEVMSLVASVNQAFIPRLVRDEGTDGEIEFFDKAGKSTGVAFRVQLKSGDSHLKKLKNGDERFPMKKHYERYWSGPNTVPVLLIIRAGDGLIRFMNATTAITETQKIKPGVPVKQLAFVGSEFTKEAILELRDERLQ